MTAMSAWADGPEDWNGRYDHMMWGSGYGWFGGIMMIGFWALIIVLVVLAIRALSGGTGSSSRPDAMDTLRERFAAGEIDEEEFEKRRKVLDR